MILSQKLIKDKNKVKMEQNPLLQIIERIKATENVLVTVSNNPSVDQLSACIGMTLLLNKIGKHGTAVFSGEVPSTIEFLKPDETIQKNTDSLQDFIIALDKAKADRLRYKVEDNVVKIFITPYRTSINEHDLEFSSGDFNVDIVIALGVVEQKDLDKTIVAHGRILHDATVVSINNKLESTVGAINWVDGAASSLSEMVAELAKQLAPDQLDAQMSTALLTGIVSETDRFRGENTTPKTMNISADLMSAGAKQQLIVTELEVDLSKEDSASAELSQRTGNEIVQETKQDDDGSLYIPHNADVVPESEIEKLQKPESEIHIDNEGTVRKARELLQQQSSNDQDKSATAPIKNAVPSHLVLEPPMLGGTFTANSRPQDLEPTTDPLSLPVSETPVLDHPDAIDEAGPKIIKDTETLQEIEKDVSSTHLTNQSGPSLAEQNSIVKKDTKTLQEIEKDVRSVHLTSPSNPDLSDARSAVEKAEIQQEFDSNRPKPLEAINAQPLDLDLQNRFNTNSTATSTATTLPKPDIPENLIPADNESQSTTQQEQPLPPPPVPPPIMPPNQTTN